MGWRYRKSLNLGPFRLNFSKSGIGCSVGNKFARVTQKANGGVRTTATIPGTGINHVEEYGAKQTGAAQGGSPNDSGGSLFKPLLLGALTVCLLIFAVVGCMPHGEDPEPDNAQAVIQEPQEQVDKQAPQTDAETQPDETPGEIQTQPEPDPTPAPDPVVEPEPDPQPTPEPQPVTTPDPTPQPTPEPEPQPEPSEPVPTLTPEQAFRESLKQYAYVGSSESDKYHKPTCRWTSKINDGNLVHFDSVEEAQAAGYEPCGTCKPK